MATQAQINLVKVAAQVAVKRDAAVSTLSKIADRITKRQDEQKIEKQRIQDSLEHNTNKMNLTAQQMEVYKQEISKMKSKMFWRFSKANREMMAMFTEQYNNMYEMNGQATTMVKILKEKLARI